MKTHINNTQGVVTYKLGDKIILESTEGIEIKGDLTIQGTTTTNARVDDRIIELAYGSTGSANSAYDAGIVINRGDDDNVFFGWDESADLFKVATGTFTGASTENLSLTLGGMQSLSLTSISLTGSNTITVPESGLIVGSTAVGSTAAELNLLDGSAKSTSSITVADDDAILIIDGNTTKQIPASDLKSYVGSSAGGTSLANLDIDGGTDIGAALVDADLLIVDDGASGTNRKTAMSRVKTYVSDLTLTTAAQTNVTSLGTLTALTVDNVTIDGTTIGHTSDTDLITLADGEATIAGTLTATTLAGTLSTAAQTNVTSLGTLSALTVSGDLTVDTSTFFVDSTNNRVGIGLTNPGKPLHMKVSIPEIKLEDLETGGYAGVQASDGNLEFYADDGNTSNNSFIVFQVDNTEHLRIHKDGNIGIGTSTFDGTAAKYLTIANGTSPAASTADQIYIGSKDSTGQSGTNGSTVALYTESVPESGHGATLQSACTHRMSVWINGTQYYLYLDPV